MKRPISVTIHALDRWRERAAIHAGTTPKELARIAATAKRVELKELPSYVYIKPNHRYGMVGDVLFIFIVTPDRDILRTVLTPDLFPESRPLDFGSVAEPRKTVEVEAVRTKAEIRKAAIKKANKERHDALMKFQQDQKRQRLLEKAAERQRKADEELMQSMTQAKGAP